MAARIASFVRLYSRRVPKQEGTKVVTDGRMKDEDGKPPRTESRECPWLNPARLPDQHLQVRAGILDGRICRRDELAAVSAGFLPL